MNRKQRAEWTIKTVDRLDAAIRELLVAGKDTDQIRDELSLSFGKIPGCTPTHIKKFADAIQLGLK
jgi:hypothetical protein